MQYEEQDVYQEGVEAPEDAQTPEADDTAGSAEPSGEEEVYYVTPDRDDVYFTVKGKDGEEHSLSPREIAELYEKVSQYETQLQMAQQLQQYAPILNYVANDELSNRVILYRLQGRSPKEIVEYLYDFYRDMEENTQPYAGNEAPVDKNVEELKRELGTLKEYITVQNVVQQNATLLMEEAEKLGFSVDEGGNYATVLTEVSKELFGDPHYLVRNPLNQRQARVVLRELQERLGKSSPSRVPAGKKAPLPPKKLPKQFPGATKAGATSDKAKPERWTLRDAAEVYNQLLGG